MAAQQRSEYRNCQDLSQATFCFPHHKTLTLMKFGFLSTHASCLWKLLWVEKLAKSMYYNVLGDLRCGKNNDKLLWDM
jgi:hypothetical protein